jgi:hypothetical protein
MPIKNETPGRRFKKVTRPVVPAEAQRWHDEEVEFQIARLEEVKRQLDEAKSAPLVSEITEAVEVKPGEPGYDDPDRPCSFREFGGTWKWITDLKGTERENLMTPVSKA